MSTGSEYETTDPALAQAVRLREEKTPRAHEELVSLAARHPHDAALAYQAAWSHDSLGLEAEAVPFYERALTGTGLAAQDRHGAFLGLGSTLRVLGRYEEAREVLCRGLDEFAQDAALRTFLAMTLYNLGESREAVRTLLLVAAATSEDPQVQAYRPAIEHYADRLDETE
ncbi:tetratricopeptide repeat protein [Streptomyces sp. NBC_00385]|uniref:tetratricopeptide repeat protein n=1 Tax=Streptomyces sp. NBC_00385 TaxID=2975733 RepID=UPI002DDB3FAB|nr:tetratricopeptide repeat protein [Streptomyces sp. NBC_00385]WRZ08612.1 tetratricopeptide repeat protein [Streptomyces sp. NBC_00385]